MKWNFKVILAVGLAMAFGSALAYVTFEGARLAIVASLPVLAALLCPISMLIMMKFMHADGKAEARASKLQAGAVLGEREDKRQTAGIA